MKKIDHLINDFVSDDDLRPQLCKPHYDNGMIVATNTDMLMLADEKYFDKKYEPVPKFPNYAQIIPHHVRGEFIGTISKKDIDQADRLLSKENIYNECEECNGDGVIVCDCCGQDSDCKDCIGSGMGNILLYKRIDSNIHVGDIGGTLFNLNYLILILKLANHIGSEIKVAILEKKKACVFYVDEIMILVMPILEIDDDQRNKVPIKLTNNI